MKLRGMTAGTPFGAKLTALCWGALTLLAPVAVSACTSSSPTAPTVISPTVTNSPTGTNSAFSGSSASSGTSASAGGTPGLSSGAGSPSSHAQPQVSITTETVTASANSTNVPPAAPVTGGGGTAGFQGTLLLVLGAAAILAGAGGLVYRRWLGRGR
jgi:hypothetical protein